MKYLIVLFLGLSSTLGFAQLQLKPLETGRSNTHSARMQSHTITLPFWDDFSTSQGTVDTTWWLPGSQTQVITKTGIGIDPPSLGVVTFDGVDALGNPYLSTTTSGKVDSLVSQPIDLTKVPVSLRNTVYLSFFYQAKGLGEKPEVEDSLFLYMKDVDGVWNKVWPASASDNYSINTNAFTEKFIQVNASKYYHDQFQFMFQAVGRQNGWFDNWLVDYVYMDKHRSASDNSYLDRAFTSLPSSIFDQYTAIPFDDFAATLDKNSLFQPTAVKLKNLESDIQPVEYSVSLFDTLNHSLIQPITTNQELILSSKELKEINAPSLDPGLLDINADSLYLMLEYYVSSGDKFLIDSIYNSNQDTAFYDHINLRVNDTTRAYFNLHDYYAFDDGTAEFGAGINQPQGKVAYQYNVVVGKYLDRIDIYFPNIDGNQTGTPLELFVLNDLDGNQNSLRKSFDIAVKHTGINQFVSYNVSPAVYLTDMFYIGFTNLSSTDNWVSVGLDKNTDSFDKIFINLDGSWVPNTNIHGSLMMRPHFTDNPVITGIETGEDYRVQVFPNPSFGEFTITGDFKWYKLMDLLGREVPSHITSQGKISYQTQTSQLLILVVETDNGSFSKRIMAHPSRR